MLLDILLLQHVLPARPLLIALPALVRDLDAARRHEVDADAPRPAAHGHRVRQAQLARLGRRVALLVRVALVRAERADQDDARARPGDVARVAGVVARHEREGGLAEGEGRGEVGVDVGAPLVERGGVGHRLAVFPLRRRDACGESVWGAGRRVRVGRACVTAVVDEHVDPAAEEAGGLLHLVADVVDIAEVADGGTDAWGVLLEVGVGGVVELGGVDVEEEDAVAFGEEETRQAPPDAPPAAANEDRAGLVRVSHDE